MYQQAQILRIQALERKSPDKPMKPAQPLKREFEYIRHRTQTLIASFDVSSGKILHESIGQTRTESDFVAHLQQMIKAYPQVKKWHLIMDCLNIHQSESLVRWVAKDEGLPSTTLGKKGANTARRTAGFKIPLFVVRSVWDSPVNGNQDRVFE